MLKITPTIIITWILIVVIIACTTIMLVTLKDYVNEMEHSDPFGEIRMQKYEQTIEKQLNEPMLTSTPTPTPTPKPTSWTGKASYYTLNGCVGCRQDRLMANGERLDDSKLTVAFNRLPLNSMVKITNLDNGKSVTAKVTDTGGFERHGRIIDTSLAVKNAIDLKTDQSSIKVEAL
jgi:rare lipoprotein A (peptidoglycan hydrolase)